MVLYLRSRYLQAAAVGVLTAILFFWTASVRPSPAKTSDRYLLVNTLRRTVTLYQGKRPILTFPVAIGKKETPTPLGEFRIIEKARWGGGFGTRWMRLSVPWGQYGLHGTNKPWSIGTRASHGCIRMFNRNVEVLYDLVTVGMPIIVTGAIPYAKIRRTLSEGAIGQDVVEAQRLLRAAGFHPGPLDGVFDAETAAAVRAFQKATGISETGRLDPGTLRILRSRQPIPPLEYGQAGPEVRLWQEVLKSLGYYAGLPDGIYGPATEKAVAAFQRSIGRRATGVLDGETQRLLRRRAQESGIRLPPSSEEADRV